MTKSMSRHYTVQGIGGRNNWRDKFSCISWLVR